MGVGQGIEAVEVDEVAAGVAEAEGLGLLVEPAQRFLDAVEVASLLAGEEEHLLPLHGVGAQVGHVVGVGVEVRVALLGGDLGQLVVAAEGAEGPLALPQEPLLELLQLLLRQLLRHGSRFTVNPLEEAGPPGESASRAGPTLGHMSVNLVTD